MKYLGCSRNGQHTQQTLDARACLACSCLFKTRKTCPAFKALTDDEVSYTLAWLEEHGYTPHPYVVRLKHLDASKYKEEIKHVKMQSVRQEIDRTRTKNTTAKTPTLVRGAMLKV